nr:group II intron maturase-specific domain-containing protein [Paenibacillus lautus]
MEPEVPPKTISRFKEKVRELTNRTRSISMEERYSRINRYLMGWIGYFRIASASGFAEDCECVCGNNGNGYAPASENFGQWGCRNGQLS